MIKREIREKSSAYRAAVLILGLLLAFNLFSFCVRFAGEYRPYHYEYSDMQRVMEAGNYPEILKMVSRNQAISAETGKDTSEFQAVAKYYEAASLYHAFAGTGDTERAAQMKERLSEAEKRLAAKEFTAAAERIGNRFRTAH